MEVIEENKKKVAVIGYGYVGKAVSHFFQEHYQVVNYDPAYRLTDKELVNKCDLAVICVPTQMNEDGKCNTSIVEKTIAWVDTPLILIKSTIPPKTTEKLSRKYKKRIAFSPEFIGEGKYFVPFWKYPHPTDMKYHDFMIIGGIRATTSKILDFFKPILGPSCRYFQTDSTTAELVKYMENSWGAMKVSFCNEFYEIAQRFEVDYDELRELFLADGRTERIHTAVFRDNRGFGGKCFPKDVNAIIKASEKAGYIPELLKQVLKSNDKFRTK